MIGHEWITNSPESDFGHCSCEWPDGSANVDYKLWKAHVAALRETRLAPTEPFCFECDDKPRCASAEICYAGHPIKPNQPETRPAPGSDLQRLRKMHASLYGNCETERETLLDLLELIIKNVAELGEE